MEATYLGDIELTDETLEHYGVKGMKWRHRKNNKTKRRYNKQGYSTDTPLTNLISTMGGQVGDDIREGDNAVSKFMNFMDQPISETFKKKPKEEKRTTTRIEQRKRSGGGSRG